MTVLLLAAVGPGPRPWVWLAAAGLLVAGLLIYRAASAVFRALPPTVQADAGAVVKRHARLAAVGGVVLLWTAVYALYSLGLPTVVSTPSARRASANASTPRSSSTTPAGDIGGVTAASPFEVGNASTGGNASGSTVPTATPRPPTPAPPAPTGSDCSAAALGDTVRQAQTLAEMLTGQPVGADFGLLVEALAGCGDPANALLSLLSPVDDVLDRLGVPAAIDLPGLPPLPIVTLPEAVAAPFRPYVFQVCSEVQSNLVTVAAVAPAIHLNYEDLSALFHQLDSICKAFAKA
jgi:hypothetical protein